MQTRELAIPEDAPLAIETRNAQMQDKVEQQHLKRLVLDYEQREGIEEVQCECRSGNDTYEKYLHRRCSLSQH